MKHMAPKPEIRAGADPTVLRVIPELATEIGLNESIVLLQIAFWIRTGNNYHDGHWWTYQSVRDMRDKAFSYWSVSTINRIAKKLIQAGYLIEGNYNQQKYDNTRWFALNIDKLQELPCLTIVDEKGQLYSNTLCQNETGLCQNDTRSTQNDTRSTQNDTTIPETPTETPTETQKQKDSLLRKNELPDFLKLVIVKELLKVGSDKSTAQIDETTPISVEEESEQPQQPIKVESQDDLPEVPQNEEPTDRARNDQYQEVVRRALGPPGEPKQPGAWVQRYIKFLKGEYEQGDKGAGQKTLEYQLDEPMTPAEIAGMTLWYRKEYKQDKIPTSYDLLRQRCDEFRALPDTQTWIDEGQKRINAIMANDDEPLETIKRDSVWDTKPNTEPIVIKKMNVAELHPSIREKLERIESRRS